MHRAGKSRNADNSYYQRYHKKKPKLNCITLANSINS